MQSNTSLHSRVWTAETFGLNLRHSTWMMTKPKNQTKSWMNARRIQVCFGAIKRHCCLFVTNKRIIDKVMAHRRLHNSKMPPVGIAESENYVNVLWALGAGQPSNNKWRVEKQKSYAHKNIKSVWSAVVSRVKLKVISLFFMAVIRLLTFQCEREKPFGWIRF